MNEKNIRSQVVKKIVDITKSRNQIYTLEVVNNVLTAFFDVVEDAITKGDSINLNGYMTIETQYRAERKARNVSENKEIIVPEHYRVNIKPGSKLNNAAAIFTKRQLEKVNVEMEEEK